MTEQFKTRISDLCVCFQEQPRRTMQGRHLQKGHASNSYSCSVCAGSLLRAAAAGPTVVPKGSLEMEAKPEVVTSAHRALGAAASPPVPCMLRTIHVVHVACQWPLALHTSSQDGRY